MCGKQGSDADPMEGVWEAISGCTVPLNPGVRHPGVSSNRCRRWVGCCVGYFAFLAWSTVIFVLSVAVVGGNLRG